MSEVTITVRGEHEARLAPELAVARVSVRVDGPERAAVAARATELSMALREELQAHQDAGALARWSSDRVSIWSDRPWSQDGAQLPLVHHATVGARGEFTDFAALSDWVTRLGDREGVTVEGIDWKLTPDTARQTERDVAAGAVRVAVERAEAYASAIGLGGVAPLEIADVGLLAQPGEAPRPQARMFAMAADSAGSSGPSLQFEPQPIIVTAAVEARFSAR
ncbi:MAG: SIMPL domain-containing protein [Microbacteriaceae bacterium]|nr:SIMPL domain-containing protein [Microbacteriaceae bacterium]HPZ33941.1 SIMPL domain-containing protein [Microbacteriaceae bacterium]HQC93859.1 SIMPL domain-containing protein [Microbacteriaceae bacterium]